MLRGRGVAALWACSRQPAAGSRRLCRRRVLIVGSGCIYLSEPPEWSTMPELSADPMVRATPVSGRDDVAANGPRLILRPRLIFRLLGPVLIVAGVLGAAAGFLPAIFIALLGVVSLIASVQWIAVDDRQVVIRGLGSSTTIPIVSIDEIRLRRVPFGPKKPMRRTSRFGPFSSTPIRLHFIRAEDTLAEITVGYWEGWAGLVQYLLAVPTIDSDSRTRGRLDRYG